MPDLTEAEKARRTQAQKRTFTPDEAAERVAAYTRTHTFTEAQLRDLATKSTRWTDEELQQEIRHMWMLHAADGVKSK